MSQQPEGDWDNFYDQDQLFQPADDAYEKPGDQEQGSEEEPVCDENPPEASGDVGQEEPEQADDECLDGGDQENPDDEAQKVVTDLDAAHAENPEKLYVWEEWEWGYEDYKAGKLNFGKK